MLHSFRPSRELGAGFEPQVCWAGEVPHSRRGGGGRWDQASPSPSSLRGSFFCLLGTAEASSQQEREGAEPALKYP